MSHRSSLSFALLLIWVCASGSNCYRNPFVHVPVAPQVLDQQPQLADVAGAVNRNAALVVSLKAPQASVALSAGGMPISLNADIAVERPRRFRLRATHALMRDVADVGSNDHLLWFWAKTLNPPALYYCRHDQFHRSPARQVMPLEPEWVIEAFGLTTFDSTGREQHQGPVLDERGRLKIHTQRQTPSGPVTKLTVVDPKSALVLEQHVFDQQGRLLVSALTSNHQQDAASGAWLPRKIDITSNATGQKMTMSIQLGQLEVNRLGAGDMALWQKPSYHNQGAPDIDLGNPNLRLSPVAAQMANMPPQGQPRPQVGRRGVFGRRRARR